jgi:hypothetical protein
MGPIGCEEPSSSAPCCCSAHKVAAICVLCIPRYRVFRNPPTVFIQPKISSTRFRIRWLIE